MAKLKFYDLPDNSISLTASYLSNRFQRTRLDNKMSPLAPLLFSVNIVSIITGPIFCNVQAYAGNTDRYVHISVYIYQLS